MEDRLSMKEASSFFFFGHKFYSILSPQNSRSTYDLYFTYTFLSSYMTCLLIRNQNPSLTLNRLLICNQNQNKELDSITDYSYIYLT